MLGADVYIGRVFSNGTVAVDDYKIGQERSTSCTGMIGVCPDVNQGGQNNILDYSGSEEDGKTTIRFSRYWDTGDKLTDYEITPGVMTIVFAMGSTDELSYHGSNKAYAEVELLRGENPAPLAPPPSSVPPVADCEVDPSRYAAKASYLEDTYHLYWTQNVKEDYLDVAIKAAWDGWVGFGIQNPSASSPMREAEVVIGWYDINGPSVQSYFIGGKSVDLIVPNNENVPLANTFACRDANGHTIIKFRRQISAGNNTIHINDDTPIIYAMGPMTGPGLISKHSRQNRGFGVINFSNGRTIEEEGSISAFLSTYFLHI